MSRPTRTRCVSQLSPSAWRPSPSWSLTRMAACPSATTWSNTRRLARRTGGTSSRTASRVSPVSIYLIPLTVRIDSVMRYVFLFPRQLIFVRWLWPTGSTRSKGKLLVCCDRLTDRRRLLTWGVDKSGDQSQWSRDKSHTFWCIKPKLLSKMLPAVGHVRDLLTFWSLREVETLVSSSTHTGDYLGSWKELRWCWWFFKFHVLKSDSSQ